MSRAPSLQGRVGSVRRHLERSARRATASWVGVAASLVLAAAWFLVGGDGWRQGTDVPLLLDAGLALVAVALWFGVRRAARRWFAEPRLARAIEGAAGLPEGSVRGPLELSRAVPPGTSTVLAGRAAERVLARLDGTDRHLAGSLGEDVRSWSRAGSGVLAGLALALTALAVLAPDRTGRAWSGLARPLGLTVDPVLEPLVVTPGDVEVPRGSEVEVRVSAPGRDAVDLAWQAAGEVARTRTLRVADGVTAHRFTSVTAPVEYRVRAPDGARIGPFRIVPVDPLFVSDLRVEVAYPTHTGLPAEEFRGEVPPLTLPEGTRLTFEGRASRPLGVAILTAENGTPVRRLSVDGASFSGAWVPRDDGRYPWVFEDADGVPAEIHPDPLEIALVPDLGPRVSIPVPGVDTLLPLDLKQPLVLEARDDYGLARLELVAWRITAFGERHEPVVQGLDLGGTRASLARPLLDLTTWGLLPGDTVRYYARVTDNAPRAQEGVSREYALWVPAAADLRREAERRLDGMADRLEEMAKEAGESANGTLDLERQSSERADGERRAADEAVMGFEEREELRRALEDRKGATDEVDSLRAELEALKRAMEEAGQADPGFSKDMEELRELLQELAAGDMGERLERLGEEAERQDPEAAKQAMEELAERQEEFRQRLEESLERFRRAAVQQDFRATKNEAEELAREQEALADAMEEGDRPELRARQQEELRSRTEELEGRMDRLQERLERLEERDAAREVSKARESAEEARRGMEHAAERLDREPDGEAGEDAARQAAEAMERAAEELSDAERQMAREQAEAARRALESTADDALALARRQSELGREMRGASQDRLAEMRADQASLLQGVRNMAQNLLDATEGKVDQNREISTQMGRAMESLQRTIDAMENRRGPAPSPRAAAEGAVQELNSLAMMALTGAERMSQGQGEGQAGQQEMSEQLERLAQEQGQLNNQASQLMPLQLGEQALAEQLRRLAERQQRVAEELGETSERPDAGEASLGDLEELAAEAEALARRMAEGRMTPELNRRQERLFHRLLDAGRSLEREEYSEEREAERPGAFDRARVAPLTAEQLGALRFRLPDAGRLQSLSPAVRQLVIQYFERLNAAAPAGSVPEGP